MAQKKYLDLTGLQKFAASLLSKFALKNHNHDSVYAKLGNGTKSAAVYSNIENKGLDAVIIRNETKNYDNAICFRTNGEVELYNRKTQTPTWIADLNKIKEIQVKLTPVTTAGTGSAYTANVPHIKTLTAGMKFTMIPHVVSAATSPTLDVNGLGAKQIRQRLSNSTLSTAPGATANWLAAGKPVDVMYDGQFWVVDFVRPNMLSAYGVLPVENGGVPSCTASDNGKFLRVVNGVATWSTVASAENASF